LMPEQVSTPTWWLLEEKLTNCGISGLLKAGKGLLLLNIF